MAKDIHVNIRMDAETKAALDKAAEAEDRSVSYLVLRAVREWLARSGKEQATLVRRLASIQRRREANDGR